MLKASRLRTSSDAFKYNFPLLHHFRHYGRSAKPYDFTKFDPQTNPNEASAVFTSLGWYFIPLKYNTHKQPRLQLEEEFVRNHFTNTTNREEVQEFIYDWCRGHIPTVHKKKMSFKSELEQKKLDLLFRQQMRDGVTNETVDKEFRDAQRLKNKANAPNEKLRFRIDPTTKKVEIRGALKMTSVFSYYVSTRGRQPDSESEKTPLTSRQLRQNATKQWSKLSPMEKKAIKQEYLQLLSNGKDLYYGKEVSLESRLSDEISEDGFRYKKSKTLTRDSEPI
ncbi:hypothetical protein KGF57_000354 [Candida theae]|uniref:Uncharacterized protein n=1 Tax=Candida theae TaxID=1198502 RepID=A0AAD5BJT0_9ASCO|nr:uncharacterized protein KGF57_000354 [Candida theae]KAI5967514.1 hypothetical protein KGF57_000354 [Candida theae]